jgi:hypothetical protein
MTKTTLSRSPQQWPCWSSAVTSWSDYDHHYAVMQALKTRLEGASPAPNIVYADPKEATSLGEFPPLCWPKRRA